MYRAIGRENLRNRREHSVEHIRTKLAILDFVLAHLDHRYLETEAEKVDYFCGKLSISRALLPAKRYSGAIRHKTYDRYFVDNFPLFFVPESSIPPVVTFSFVDPGLLSLANFETHLLAYGSLFSALPALRFIYIATRATHFDSAQKLFLTTMRRAPNTDPGDEVLRYFTLRHLWEAKQYGKLNNEDIEFLNRATKRFDDAPTDIRYRQWTLGRVSSEAVRAEFRNLAPKQDVSFSTELVDGQLALFEPSVPSQFARTAGTKVTQGLHATFGSAFGPAFARGARHLLPKFGAWRLKDITKAEVQRFLADKRKQGFSDSSVHGMRTALGKVLQAAVDWNYLEHNFARGIRLGDRSPVQERIYLLPNQLSLLLASLSEPCRTLVLVVTLTGLRTGELLALRWKHIDLKHDVIHVGETVYEGQFGSPKTKSSRRDVPMSQPVREALMAQRNNTETEPEQLVFASRNGTPINPKNLLRRVLQPACRKLNLPVISWHSFRHTHATLLGEVGESLRTAQAILGHSDLKTTLNVYTHAPGVPEACRRQSCWLIVP